MEQVLDVGVLIIALLAVVTGIVVLVKMYREEIQDKDKSETLVHTTFPQSEGNKNSPKNDSEKSKKVIEPKGV